MIKIIDLYSGNPRDFEEALNGTFSGVIFKAGQGNWLDIPVEKPDWWKIAGDKGLKRGWYWVCDSRYHSSKHIEAINQWRDITSFDLNAELGFWSDVEYPYYSMTTEQYWQTPFAGHKNVLDFHYLLKENEIDAGLYSADGVYNEIMKGASSAQHDYLAKFPLWCANYPFIYIPGISKPRMFGHWTTWNFWQYHGNPDYNEFNGTDQQFADKYGAAIPPEPPGEKMITIATVISPTLNIRSTPDLNSTTNIIGPQFLRVGDILYCVEETSTCIRLTKAQRGVTALVLPGPVCWASIGAAYVRQIWHIATDAALPVNVKVTANGAQVHNKDVPAGGAVAIAITD